jgi:multiple sugar transport system substrate-binding protein
LLVALISPAWTYPILWTFGGAETNAAGRVVLNGKGALEAVKWMVAFWKDACDEGALAWDDTNNNRAFHAGEISATLNGASIYIVAKRQKDKIKDDRGEPMWTDIDHAPLPAGPSGAFLLFLNHSDAIMKYSKNPKLAKDFLRWVHKPENYGKWFTTQEGYSVGDQEVGERPHVGQARRAAQDVPDRRPQHPAVRLRRPVDREGHRGFLQVHRHRHVRQGRAGHEGGRRGEVGVGRAQEDLRGLIGPAPSRGPRRGRWRLRITT